MPPKFALQPVLNYRHSMVESLEIKLTRLIRMSAKVEIYIEQLIEAQLAVMESLRIHMLNGEFNLPMILQNQQAVHDFDEMILTQSDELEELSKQIESARDSIVMAKQDEDALVKLKEKGMERFQSEQALREDRMRDDLYISMAYQKLNGRMLDD